MINNIISHVQSRIYIELIDYNTLKIVALKAKEQWRFKRKLCYSQLVSTLDKGSNSQWASIRKTLPYQVAIQCTFGSILTS